MPAPKQRFSTPCAALGSILFFALFAGGYIPNATAQVPEHRSRRFLDALREMGFYEEALDFLSLAGNDPTVNQDIKNAVDFERGMTLLELSKTRRNDLNQREKDLDAAETAFKAYITARERDKFGLTAKIELGTVLMQRAAVAGFKAAKPNAKKGELFAEARNKLKEAGDVFTKIEADIKARLDGFPKTGLSPAREAERDRLRDEYVRAKLLNAATLMESSKYVDPSSPQRNELLTNAANAYGDIHRKYSKYKAGMTAVNQKAECQRLMGAYKEALSTLEIILPQAEVPDLQFHVKQALGIAVPCWMALKQYDVMLAKVSPVLEEMSEKRLTQADIELKLVIGRAGLDLQKEYQTGEKPAQYVGLRKLAIDEWKSLKRIPGYGPEANAALEQLGAAGATSSAVVGYVRPKNYTEAHNKLNELVTKYEDNRSLLAAIVKKNDPAMAQEQAAMEKEQDETRKAGVAYARDCLILATDEQTSDDINDDRWKMGYLLWQSKHNVEAAQLLAFVAKRYPRFANAASACQIAVYSYLEYIKDNPSGDPDLSIEKDRAMKAGLYMVETWPSDAKTIEIIAIVVPLLIQQGEVKTAVDLLAKVPNDNPKKGQLEIDIGSAVWRAYRGNFSRIRAERLQATKENKPVAEFDTKQTENEKLKLLGLEILEAGIAKKKNEPEITQATAVAALNLAEIYVEADVDKALATLNDPKFGPLTLVRANDPKVADVQGFALTTFRTALSANIGAMASGKDAAAYAEAAKALLADIVKLTGDTEEGRKIRFQEFRRLASNLLAQLELAPKEKQAAISSGIQLFLNQVVSESKDPEELLWASAMYQQMIAIVGRDEKGKLNAQGTELADKSNAVLGKLEQTYANQKDEKAAAMQVVIAKKRASVFREMGKFSEAIDIYEGILADPKRRNDLITQEEAAEALQQWGDDDNKMYQKAVMGDRPAKSGKPENVIWGWNKIGLMLNRAGIGNNPRFAEMFFRARLETARCVFKMSSLIKEEKKKQSNVQNAAGVIITTYNGHPNFDGPETKKKFDELLKEIQRAQGENLPQGLGGIKQAAPPANPKAAPPNGQPANGQPANAPPANAEANPANQ